ncbi:MAG: flagellar motor protein [Deltaproteobacteria bacterium]|nr:flagellar motor protein [Deltaproteobacteria bacterium]
MDAASVVGVALALSAIFGGFLMEGGKILWITQPTAAIIVFGGTIGAVFLTFPVPALKRAGKGLASVVFEPKLDLAELVKSLVGFAQKARRDGVVSLEGDAVLITDPFLKKALNLAVDGSDSRVVREAMEGEMQFLEGEGEAGSKVFEAAGGYAPTIGILGAVLGLIQVMQNLTEPEKLGHGIAVAFVATVYGVGSANVLFLPISGKLKARHQRAMLRYEVILNGVAAIVDGENPRIIEEKLNGLCGLQGAGAADKGAAERRRQAA